jgi:hypothetical protein
MYPPFKQLDTRLRELVEEFLAAAPRPGPDEEHEGSEEAGSEPASR